MRRGLWCAPASGFGMQENSLVRNWSSVGRLVLAASRFTSSRSTDDGWYFTSCKLAAVVMSCLLVCVQAPAALHLMCACVS